MFQKLSNSFSLACSSWRVLMTDKRLIVFPILSGLACVLVLASFIVPLVLANPNVDELPGWLMAVLGAGFYFASYFVIIFFNAALISCALVRLGGGTPTIGGGLRAAMSRLPQIFAWAIVSASVGMILKAIENAHEKAGRFIAGILGAAWSVFTFFVVPVLVVERTGAFSAIGRSTSILKKTWGESLIGSFGIGLFILLITIPGIILLGLGIYSMANVNAVTVLGVVLVVAGILYILAASAVGAALQGIYVSALYRYAEQGTLSEEFDQDTIRHAFKHAA